MKTIILKQKTLYSDLKASIGFFNKEEIFKDSNILTFRGKRLYLCCYNGLKALGKVPIWFNCDSKHLFI